MQIALLLLQTFAISAALFVLLWLINLRTRDPSFIDSWWGLGMVVIAWASFLIVGSRGPHAVASPWYVPLCAVQAACVVTAQSSPTQHAPVGVVEVQVLEPHATLLPW